MKFSIYFFFVSLTALGQAEFEKTEQLFAKNQFAKAQDLLVVYVKSHPGNLKGIELLGDAYGHQKKWDEAIESYKKLVDVSPKTANYHYKYGGALGMKALSVNKIKALGIIGDVKDAFITAAELDPQHIETRWALMELYMQLPGIIGGSKSKSLKYADELQNLSKVDGYLAKGYIHEYDEELDLAEKYYKLAVKEGGSVNCFEKLTNLYEKQKQPDKAFATMEAAQVKHDRNLFNYQIGKVAAEYNVQLKKGENYLHTYIKTYSSEDDVPKAWAYYRLAQIYKHQKNKKDALEYIELAIAELPSEARFKKERAIISNLN